MSATEMTQVMINVVANGAQAVAARGVPHGKALIVARLEADMLEFQIVDDGVGMAPEVLNGVGTPPSPPGPTARAWASHSASVFSDMPRSLHTPVDTQSRRCRNRACGSTARPARARSVHSSDTRHGS